MRQLSRRSAALDSRKRRGRREAAGRLGSSDRHRLAQTAKSDARTAGRSAATCLIESNTSTTVRLSTNERIPGHLLRSRIDCPPRSRPFPAAASGRHPHRRVIRVNPAMCVAASRMSQPGCGAKLKRSPCNAGFSGQARRAGRKLHRRRLPAAKSIFSSANARRTRARGVASDRASPRLIKTRRLPSSTLIPVAAAHAGD